MIKDNIKNMIKVSEDKKALMDEFHRLTREQNKLIKENQDDISPLDKLIEEKSKIIKKVDNLDKKFLLDYESIKEKLDVETLTDVDGSEYPEIKDLKLLIEDINLGFKEISKLDKENNHLIKKNMDGIKSELRSVKGVKRAQKGYGNQAENQSIMIDERK